jgi:hypothetical protein
MSAPQIANSRGFLTHQGYIELPRRMPHLSCCPHYNCSENNHAKLFSPATQYVAVRCRDRVQSTLHFPSCNTLQLTPGASRSPPRSESVRNLGHQENKSLIVCTGQPFSKPAAMAPGAMPVARVRSILIYTDNYVQLVPLPLCLYIVRFS